MSGWSGSGDRRIRAKSVPASECKYGDWRDCVDWKAARILWPIGIGGIIVLLVLIPMIFGG